MRTLQRKIKRWHAEHGPQKEVIPAGASAGRVRAKRLHVVNDLAITIDGEPFDHLVYHFVLPFSQEETGIVWLSESFETRKHRTDNRSVATHEPSTAISRRWRITRRVEQREEALSERPPGAPSTRC